MPRARRTRSSWSRSSAVAAALAVALALGGTPPSVDAAAVVDPMLRFEVTRTAHFVIYFHQGEGEAAQALAVIAEETWGALAARLGPPPPARTHVVLVDQTDLANGSATPLPRDAIVITAVWPAGSEYIGRTEDWLRLVFTHEFTHIVHLDRSEGWARLVRNIFGRAPLAYPNLFLPVWQIEGLATYEESALTGEGRLHAGDFRQITDAAARHDAVEPLDRANGGLTDWPGGLAAYAYGLGFHAYLAETYGDAKLRELADRTARRVPYTASLVFKDVFGRSLGDLWREYQQSLVRAQPAVPPSTAVARITHHGFYVTGPRFDRSPCEGCQPRLIYSVRTPHELPSLNRVALDGTGDERLVTRYLGSTTAVGPHVVVFDQQELRRNTGLYSDLYALDPMTRHLGQLTREARIIDPDLAADGSRIVAVQQSAPGRRALVTLTLSAAAFGTPSIRTLTDAPATQFNTPKWSPDGRLIAVERHEAGALSEVVVVDAESGAIRARIARRESRVVTPAWRPDGHAVIVAAAEGDAPFQLFEVSLDGSTWRRLTDVDGGAFWPEVSPDGSTLVFVGYTVDGFDLFKTAYRPGVADVSAAPANRFTAASPTMAPARATRYLPLTTLPPTSWSPVLEIDRRTTRLGAATAGADILGYHAYAAAATWRLSSPAGAPGVSASEPDWQVAYAYARWRPVFYASASLETSFFAGPPAENGAPSEATLRERSIEAGAVLPFEHVRRSHTITAAFVAANDHFTFVDGPVEQRRNALRAGWLTSTAHTFGYSISPERGLTAGATAERVDGRLGASADASAASGDVRAYVPGLRRHDVLAIRGAAAAASGDRDLRRVFLLGGAGPDATPLDFGSGAISLLRGFPVDTFAGTHAALVNADYRFAIARPQRGAGTWPLFLHTVHAAVFADAGHAWTSRFRAGDLKTSYGGELSLDIVAGYSLPLTIAGGIARGHDGSGRVADQTTIYARVGRAF